MVGTREIIYGFFLAIGGILFWRRTYLGSGRLPLPGRLSRVERRGRGSRVGGFGGLVVEVIVGEGSAGGGSRISTGEVSRNTNSEKCAHTLRFVTPQKERMAPGLSVNYRWTLPVPHYPRNMVIYHYPPIGVIL